MDQSITQHEKWHSETASTRPRQCGKMGKPRKCKSGQVQTEMEKWTNGTLNKWLLGLSVFSLLHGYTFPFSVCTFPLSHLSIVVLTFQRFHFSIGQMFTLELFHVSLFPFGDCSNFVFTERTARRWPLKEVMEYGCDIRVLRTLGLCQGRARARPHAKLS